MLTKQYNRLEQTEKPPADLDHGRLEWKNAAIFGAMIIAGGAGGITLGLAAWSIVPGDYQPWSVTRAWGVGGAAVLSAICWTFAAFVAWRMFAGWQRHAAWVEDCRAHWLASSAKRNGLAIAEQTNEYTLYPNKVPDLVLATIWIQYQVEAGEHAPWSVRSLRGDDGPLMLTSGSRSASIGTFTPTGAEEVGRIIAQAGMVRGRKGGTAGEWIPTSMEEAIEMIVKGAK